MGKLYCIVYGGGLYGFIKPYNAVRDCETFSNTYLPPSLIMGIVKENNLSGQIVRHKLQFDGMCSSDFKRSRVFTNIESMFTIRHSLVHPVITLAFDTKADYEIMLHQSIYVGQHEYLAMPIRSFVCSESDFDGLPGVETFLTTKEDPEGFYCGNNRQDNNSRMYVEIVRNEWES